MAANEAVFKHGQPLFTDYTPGSAVLGGEVQVVGAVVLIPHRDIAASEQSAVAAFGGVYEVTGDAVIAVGSLLYWNAAAGKVTETATSNNVFGWAVEASSGDGDRFLAVHMPRP